jgi:hypothetical protein
MIPEAVLHLLAWLELVRCDHARYHDFKERKKIKSSIKIKSTMEV